MADIPVHISNVKASLRCSVQDATVSFENPRWNRTLCSNEVSEVVVSAQKAWLKLVSDTDSVNPRSTRHRKYCVLSYDSENCHRVTECFASVLGARVHDFTQPSDAFSSWGYDKQLSVLSDKLCVTMPDKFAVFARDDICGVTLSRAGGGARTFDVCIHLKNTGTFELENVDNSLHGNLMEVLNAEEVLSSDSDADACDDDDGDWHSDCSDEDDSMASEGPLSSDEAEATDSDCTEESCDSE